MSVAQSAIQAAESISDIEVIRASVDVFKGIAAAFFGLFIGFCSVIIWFVKREWDSIRNSIRDRSQLFDAGLESWADCNKRVEKIEQILTDQCEQNQQIIELQRGHNLTLNSVQMTLNYHATEIDETKKKLEANTRVLTDHGEMLASLGGIERRSKFRG